MDIIKKRFSPNKISTYLTVLFLVIGVVGIVQRMLVPLTPFTGPDSVGYLGVAFRFMTDGIFGGIAERSYAYPAFITLIIDKSQDVENIVLIQRVLSIFSALLFYQIFKLVYFEFHINKVDRYLLYKPLSVFFSLLIIFSPSQNLYEQFTHPEAVTLPIVFLLTYAVLKLYKNIIVNRVLSIFLWLFVALITNYYLSVLQPRMTLGCYFIFLMLLLSFFKIRRGVLIRLIVFAIPVISIIWINNTKLVRDYSYRDLVECGRSASLFYYNLNTINKIIRQDIDDPAFAKINKNYLKQILVDYEESKKPQYINYSSGSVPTIGYNTDYLMKTYVFLLGQKDLNPKTVKLIYRYYLFKALEKDPLGLASKVIKEILSYYATGVFLQVTTNISYTQIWTKSLGVITTWPKAINDNKVYRSYVSRLETSINSDYHHQNASYKISDLIFKIVNLLFLPVLIITLISLFYFHCIKRNSKPYGVFLFITILFHNLILLTMSIGASTTCKRYVFDMFPTTMLVFVGALIYIIFCLGFKRDKINKGNEQ
jgi:hypothetical protein